MGVKRVIFPREFTIEDIKKIDVPIEKEMFIHGALCVSYSGRCLMSALLGGRSGNRGECTGCCRLKYTLKDNKVIDNGYLLSMKELNLGEHIHELEELGICSLKIEGRMKSPTYVAFLAEYYRNILDHKKVNLDELKILFNRGFTLGRLYGTDNLINKKSPNHIGLEIGKVIEVNKNKIKIKLSKKIDQEDGIRFKESNKGMYANFIYDKNMKLIPSSSDIIYLDNKVDLNTLDTVYKTTSKELENRYKCEINKKIGVKIYCKARINEQLELTYIDINNNKATLKGNIVEKSVNSPIEKEKITELLTRLGNTMFKSTEIIVENDSNVFIRIKELNDLRREAIDKLISLRKEVKIKSIIKEVVFDKIQLSNKYDMAINLTDKIIDNVRMDTNDLKLYNKFKANENVYYIVPLNTIEISKNLQERNIISEIIDCSKINAIGSYHLNVYNAYTAYYLFKLGYKSITLSVELSDKEKQYIVNKLNIPFEVDYGNIEVMTIKGNILNIEENKDYELNNINGSFKVNYTNPLTHIYYNLDYSNKNVTNVTTKIN